MLIHDYAALKIWENETSEREREWMRDLGKKAALTAAELSQFAVGAVAALLSFVLPFHQ
ncbi:hypothetical protein [Cohnella pontilimi]|uniref:hypothetical protein n=1 Tax=Cohnella pontilimi TaxID=2564100 RepID=UPI00145D9161|nr:hypothetical protein [Cohnella pontilimi]